MSTHRVLIICSLPYDETVPSEGIRQIVGNGFLTGLQKTKNAALDIVCVAGTATENESSVCHGMYQYNAAFQEQKVPIVFSKSWNGLVDNIKEAPFDTILILGCGQTHLLFNKRSLAHIINNLSKPDTTIGWTVLYHIPQEYDTSHEWGGMGLYHGYRTQIAQQYPNKPVTRDIIALMDGRIMDQDSQYINELAIRSDQQNSHFGRFLIIIEEKPAFTQRSDDGGFVINFHKWRPDAIKLLSKLTFAYDLVADNFQPSTRLGQFYPVVPKLLTSAAPVAAPAASAPARNVRALLITDNLLLDTDKCVDGLGVVDGMQITSYDILSRQILSGGPSMFQALLGTSSSKRSGSIISPNGAGISGDNSYDIAIFADCDKYYDELGSIMPKLYTNTRIVITSSTGHAMMPVKMSQYASKILVQTNEHIVFKRPDMTGAGESSGNTLIIVILLILFILWMWITHVARPDNEAPGAYAVN